MRVCLWFVVLAGLELGPLRSCSVSSISGTGVVGVTISRLGPRLQAVAGWAQAWIVWHWLSHSWVVGLELLGFELLVDLNLALSWVGLWKSSDSVLQFQLVLLSAGLTSIPKWVRVFALHQRVFRLHQTTLQFLVRSHCGRMLLATHMRSLVMIHMILSKTNGHPCKLDFMPWHHLHSHFIFESSLPRYKYIFSGSTGRGVHVGQNRAFDSGAQSTLACMSSSKCG
ncbi:hypothetical protein FNV43_RR27277 [Rhamnella rubrinervis]|uniref:Secreted protein n=1 Tax=Rhamnella rubrinervis TaxID=2594499 RepID=A0A8K0GKG2_9ROSA|nr:hypothetical protein FNV43_RR27277 [Rhamnella rubrinervis]